MLVEGRRGRSVPCGDGLAKLQTPDRSIDGCGSSATGYHNTMEGHMSSCAAAKEVLPAVYEAFAAAIERQDAEALARFYTADCQVFPTGADIVSGVGAIPSFFDAFFAMGIKRCSFETFEIEEHGEIAYETGRATLYADGGAIAGTIKYLVIWRCEDGAWLVHRDILSGDAPPA
jgi:uncharacterized protein (TIGR02246 family)